MSNTIKVPLLEIKDSDIRIKTIEQAYNAVDHGIHAGGAFSAVVPLVSLYYGGVMNYDVENPLNPNSDGFILSKGHCIAPLAAIMADLGYFDSKHLYNSRSIESILNGHPGPLLPGIPVATGPLGQGISVAVAIAISRPGQYSYCLMGDGEMQEGSVWEALMYAGVRKLKNLCVLIDCNNGQLDRTDRLLYETDLAQMVSSFGFDVTETNGMAYGPVLEALHEFKAGKNMKPTALLCRTVKGYGAFSPVFQKHKLNIDSDLYMKEITAQRQRRSEREKAAVKVYEGLNADGRIRFENTARQMRLELGFDGRALSKIDVVEPVVKTLKPAPRKKEMEDRELMKLEAGKEYPVAGIISDAMENYAVNGRVVSIDADLASTSGLFAGVSKKDPRCALNVGIAETNMINMAEGFAVDGKKVWVSTFCPFFDLRSIRRLAIGWQEREEVIREGGWLSEGFNADITFVATASNFDTVTNGSTHMGNDDIMFISEIAHVNIIDVSCPRLLQSIIRWIMAGSRGLVYLRLPRAPIKVIYPEAHSFEYGKGYIFNGKAKTSAVIVSSGRGVHEAMEAQRYLGEKSISIDVADMPSFDKELALSLCSGSVPVIFAEQNNGYLYSCTVKTLFESCQWERKKIYRMNTLGKDMEPRFIHSGTYPQLVSKFGLDGKSLADKIMKILEGY